MKTSTLDVLKHSKEKQIQASHSSMFAFNHIRTYVARYCYAALYLSSTVGNTRFTIKCTTFKKELNQNTYFNRGWIRCILRSSIIKIRFVKCLSTTQQLSKEVHICSYERLEACFAASKRNTKLE
uniref:Uncharacterized protein n=1 Tax=Glossina pallidipes TaxID=7398 RepID=A0A1B0ADG5_GLOPL